jgi:hypothetical protein
MLAALVQRSRTLHHIAIIFLVDIAQAMDEDFSVLSKFKYVAAFNVSQSEFKNLLARLVSRPSKLGAFPLLHTNQA